jgi:hypothetical protein
MARTPLVLMQHEGRTALPYHRGRRFRACFTRHMIESRCRFVLGQFAYADLPPLHDALEQLEY